MVITILLICIIVFEFLEAAAIGNIANRLTELEKNREKRDEKDL